MRLIFNRLTYWFFLKPLQIQLICCFGLSYSNHQITNSFSHRIFRGYIGIFSCKACLYLLHGCLFRLDGDLSKQFLHLLIKILQASPRILILKDHRLEPFGFYSFQEACVIIIFQNLLQVFSLSLLSRALQSLLGTLLLVELMLYIFDLLQNCAEVRVLSVRTSGSHYIFSARRMPESPLHRLFVH